MIRAKSFRTGTLAFTLASLLCASSGMATEPTTSTLNALNPQSPIVDVALRDGGILVGQVVDAQRMPISAHQVVVRSQGKPIITVMTDEHGRFAIRGMRGGTYTIQTAKGSGTFQLWAPNTAPPSAQTAAVVTSQRGLVMRGQDPDRRRRVAAAIAVGLGIGAGVWAFDYNAPGS